MRNTKRRYSRNYRVVTIGSKWAGTVTEPTTEPVSLAEFKAYHRITTTEEDEFIEQVIIPAARHAIEKKIQSAIATQTKQVNLDCWIRHIALPIPPWVSVTQVQYYTDDSPEVLTTLSSDSYRFDPYTGELHFIGDLPSIASREDAVQIQWVAGKADPAQPLKSAILLVGGDLYENREGQVIGMGLTKLESKTVEWLIDPYRSYR